MPSCASPTSYNSDLTSKTVCSVTSAFSSLQATWCKTVSNADAAAGQADSLQNDRNLRGNIQQRCK
jgi:hypothetical protein